MIGVGYEWFEIPTDQKYLCNFSSASNEEKLIELLDEVQMDLVKGIVDLPPLEIFMKMIIYWLPINRRGLQPTQTVQKTRPL